MYTYRDCLEAQRIMWTYLETPAPTTSDRAAYAAALTVNETAPYTLAMHAAHVWRLYTQYLAQFNRQELAAAKIKAVQPAKVQEAQPMKIDTTDGYHTYGDYAYQITHKGHRKWMADIRRRYNYGIDGPSVYVLRAASKAKIVAAVHEALGTGIAPRFPAEVLPSEDERTAAAIDHEYEDQIRELEDAARDVDATSWTDPSYAAKYARYTSALAALPGVAEPPYTEPEPTVSRKEQIRRELADRGLCPECEYPLDSNGKCANCSEGAAYANSYFWGD